MLLFYSYDSKGVYRFKFQYYITLWNHIGGIRMANLKKEYTDIRDMRHKVEHLMVSSEDKNNKEQIIQELFQVLTKTDRRILA